jgi:hypothetical protein
MAVRVATATAALEAPTATIGTTIATAIAISSARPVEAPTSAAIATAIPSTALRPLESRARIAAYARGIPAHEIFAWSVGVSRSACFTGQQHNIFLDR